MRFVIRNDGRARLQGSLSLFLWLKSEEDGRCSSPLLNKKPEINISLAEEELTPDKFLHFHSAVFQVCVFLLMNF